MPDYTTHRYGWQNWWLKADDGRKVRLSIDPLTPLDEQGTIALSVGTGKPVLLTDSQVGSLIAALHEARHAAKPRDEVTNQLLSGRGMR